ncbi:MAG: efflux RND transporter periplasmic adaptor subunit, partial [Gemmatimonadota bacterium]
MKTRQVVALLVTAGVLGAGVWYYLQSRGGSAQSFRTATIERGPIQSTVAATGALGAVKTVQVGTQVSGQIAAILVDFNDKVKKGQLIARIDPKLAQQAIQDAEAGLAKANAQLIQTQALYQQNKTLHDQRIITDTDFNTAQANFQVAKADLASAQVSVDRARQNLAYTNIYAPIDGVVVERNMDVGQTVAASLSAPQLFLIAND